MSKITIGVIGSNNLERLEEYEFVENLGYRLIKEGYRIVCGGLGGVMEAIAKGAKRANPTDCGDVVCIIPSNNKSDANPYCDVIIPTGFGLARNLVVVHSADILIAIKGGAGTLSEMSFAWQYGKKVLCVTNFGGWAKEMAAKAFDNRHSEPEKLLIPVSSIDEIIEQLNIWKSS